MVAGSDLKYVDISVYSFSERSRLKVIFFITFF
jgi:hypothetical protein